MRTSFILLAAVVGCSAMLGAQSDSGAAAFVAWGRQSLHPLRTTKPGGSTADLVPFDPMIAGARVVAASEAVHGGAEPLEFRNRLFQYLVEHDGFTVIAIESGLTEGRVAHDYVRDGTGELATALSQGLTWTFDKLPQNAELLRWMRAYNADPKHSRHLRFYGFDVPGSPGNPLANRRMRTALDEVLAYLQSVDSESATLFHGRLDKFLPNIQFDPSLGDSAQYLRLSQAERETLTGTIAELIALLERREASYRAARSAEDYEWAYRNALGVRAADLWLRQVPIGWKLSDGLSFFRQSQDIRDRFQADAISWILEREPGAKVLIFASRYHISSAPVNAPVNASPSSPRAVNAVAGTYLRSRLGRSLVTLGNSIGRGDWGCSGQTGKLEPATTASLDGIAGTLGSARYYLDLRSAPPVVRGWLDQEWSLGKGLGDATTNIAKAYDILVYFDTVSVACQ